jgi:hypothetical protein
MSKDLIRANTGVQDPLIWNTNADVFAPRKYNTINLFYPDHREIKPETPITTGWGEETSFKFQKTFDQLVNTRITFDVAQLTGGTNPRFIDWAGIRAIEYVELVYQGNHLQKVTGKQIYDEIIKEWKTEQKEAAAQVSGGLLSNAQRQALAAGSQHFEVPLGILYFSKDLSYSLPVHCLSTELELVVKFQSLANVANTDGTAPAGAAMSNLRCHAMFTHVSPVDRADRLAKSQQGEGFMYSFIDRVVQQKAVAATTDTSLEIELKNIRGPITELRVTRLKDTAWNSGTAYTNDPGAYEVISTIEIEGSGSLVMRSEDSDSLQYVYDPMYHPNAEAGHRIYSVYWALDPGNKVDCTGSVNFGMLNNPVMTLTFPNIAAASTIFIEALERNFIQLRSGDIIKTFK